MKTKIEIKSQWGDKILFEYKREDNTIKDTLQEAVKQGANLRGADLGGANLRGANLRGAHLEGAKLGGANLKDANLEGAHLCDANLEYAYIKGANLRCANLEGAKEIPYIRLACPSDGSFIGWKKVGRSQEYGITPFLVKLEIPEDALRSSATTSKCRCSKAKVLEITNIETGKAVNSITNINEIPCVYKVGEMVLPDSFDEDRFRECSHGIHFFINKQDAIEY